MTMTSSSGLVDGPTLLATLWDETSRPSLRWLRDQQKRRAIPYIKIGRLVFFDPKKVAAHLEQKRTITPIEYN